MSDLKEIKDETELELENIIQKIRTEIEKENYEIAKEIGEKFPDCAPIQSKIVKIAIKESDYAKAKKIGEKFPNDPKIQSQMITIAIKERDYETGKEIGKNFPDNHIIQSQMVTIAMDERDYETAEEIGKKFPDDPIIQSPMEHIKYLKKKQKNSNIEEDDDNKRQENFERKQQLIKEKMMVRAIKYGEYDKAEKIGKKYPDNINMQLLLMKIAIKREDYKEVEKIGEKFPNNPMIQSIIKQLKDFKVKEHQKIEPPQEKTNKSNKKKFIGSIKVEKKNIEKDQKHLRNIEYYNIIINYLQEKRKDIYVKMNSNMYDEKIVQKAISHWDKMEILLEKVELNKNDGEFLYNLYKKISLLKEKEENIVTK